MAHIRLCLAKPAVIDGVLTNAFHGHYYLNMKKGANTVHQPYFLTAVPLPTAAAS
jgi:hypothetical protein